MSSLLSFTPFLARSAATPVHGRCRLVLTQWCAASLSAVRRLCEARRYRQDRARLMALDSRMLSDLGIDRSEIDSVLIHGRLNRRRPGL